MPDLPHQFRPRYHFTAPAGWINDPNGLIHIDGVYHLFYQFHPDPCPKDWWRKEWGHATSADLVTWRDAPVALQPGAGRADSDGCWSGCAVDAGDEIRVYYTGVVDEMVQRLCLARAGRDLGRLEPERDALAVEGIDYPRGRTFRDPYVWRDGATWRALIAGSPPGAPSTEGAMELASDDGLSWRIARWKIHAGPSSKLTLECPNRFVIDGREVILASAQPLWTPLYIVGEPGDTHPIESMKLLMSGSRFYAPLVFRDARGRLIMMGYCEEARSFESIAAEGWCNTLSLPIELSLNANAQLCCRPVAELDRLRGDVLAVVEDISVNETPRFLERLAGPQCEIECEIAVGEADKFFLDVLADPQGREFTRVEIDLQSGGIEIDNSHSSLDASTANHGGNERQGPRKTDWRQGPTSGRITLRIFIDHSIVDVFSDAGVFATQRAYPSLAESTGIRVSCRGSGARMVRGAGWEMGEIVSRCAAD